MSDIRVCERDGEPLIFTFEYAGAEYVCQVCGNLEGVFGSRAPATEVRTARLSKLRAEHDRAAAQRAGREYQEPAMVGDGSPIPVCRACGRTPPEGTPLSGGKPGWWYSRTIAGATEYVCSRNCIPAGEGILPW